MGKIVQIIFRQCKKRARVGIKLVATIPQIVFSLADEFAQQAGIMLVRNDVGRICVQHPCLHVGIFLFIHQMLVEICRATPQNIFFDFHTSVARQ